MSKFKLVPVEPTPEMMNALTRVASYAASWEQGYKAMLEAAPEQPVQEPVGYVESSVHGAGGFHCRLLTTPTPPFGTKLYTAPPDADKLLRQALDAIEAELSPDWNCNSYHPKLHAAHAALRKHMGEE